MQRQDFTVPNQSFSVRGPPPFAAANADDFDTDSDSPDFLRGEESEPHPPVRRSIGWLFGCAILGAGLAVAWRYVDFQHLSSIRLWAAAAAQPGSNTTASVTTASVEQIAHLSQQVDGLVRKTEDLANAQQQIGATIAALQANQQALAQRLAAAPSALHAWYSDPVMLRDYTWTPPRSASANERQHAVKPVARRDEHAREPDHGSPLSLSSQGQ